jgi:hypothetical protein
MDGTKQGNEIQPKSGVTDQVPAAQPDKPPEIPIWKRLFFFGNPDAHKDPSAPVQTTAALAPAPAAPEMVSEWQHIPSQAETPAPITQSVPETTPIQTPASEIQATPVAQTAVETPAPENPVGLQMDQPIPLATSNEIATGESSASGENSEPIVEQPLRFETVRVADTPVGTPVETTPVPKPDASAVPAEDVTDTTSVTPATSSDQPVSENTQNTPEVTPITYA